LIFSPHPSRLKCDHIGPVKSAALGDKAPLVGCSRRITLDLVLTTQGTWIPTVLPPEWQILVMQGRPHSVFGVRCPAHRETIAAPEKPSGLVMP
jgi:hypothetical protein